MAPEIVKEEEYDAKKTDMWALGVLLFNMCYGRSPFRADNERDLYIRIIRGIFAFPCYDNDYSNDLKNTIKSMICVDTMERISIWELKNSDWINSNN
mmetsp:Transcript_22282/g.15891  ORF Transcript_22282/g.15891 Transcript_22282/m.15891 type:complete len:97 (-) Transcript_22282:55-345(-)